MAKVYVVSDHWQYDGGQEILGIYTNSLEALKRQQSERQKLHRHVLKHNLRSDFYSTHRYEAICIEEHEAIDG